MRIAALSGWTSEQRHVVVACFLGWALDAFDFFLMVFILKDIAQEFNTQITDVTRTSHTSPPIQGLSHTFRKSPVACDWVVVSAVRYEPVSARGVHAIRRISRFFACYL